MLASILDAPLPPENQSLRKAIYSSFKNPNMLHRAVGPREDKLKIFATADLNVNDSNQRVYFVFIHHTY